MNNATQTQTHTGTLVTDGYTETSSQPRTIAMGVVSDDGTGVTRPVTSWLFTIITAVGLLTFLFVSFYRYRKRLREKRDREEEYIRVFKELLPDCDYDDFKVTRARSVMTNTHFNTYPNLDNLEFGIGPPIGRRLFRSFAAPPTKTRPFGHQTTQAETHQYYVHNFGHPLPITSSTKEISKDLADIEDYGDFPYIDGYVDESQEIQRGGPEFQKISKKPGVKMYDKSKVNGKYRRKKQKAFLKAKARTGDNASTAPTDDFIEISDYPYQSSYLSDLHLNLRSEDAVSSEFPLKAERQVRSDSDICTFASEELKTKERISSSYNDYYTEAGIPKPVTSRGLSGRRRRSSVISSGKETIQPNAFYDRLVPREKPTKEYEELVHRDTDGFVNAHARSLPCLDTEYHRNHVNVKDIFKQAEASAHAPQEVDAVSTGSSPRRSSDPLLLPREGLTNKGSEGREASGGMVSEMKVLLGDTVESSQNADRTQPGDEENKKQTTKL